MDAQAISQKSIRQRRRWRVAVGLNVSLSLALAVLLVGLLNGLSARYYLRTDISRAGIYTLSDQTRYLLGSLTNAVDVIVFFQRGEEIYHDVESLLREYQYLSPMLRVEYVDPDRNLARTEELARRFEVNEPNVIIFHHEGRSRILTETDIMQYDFSGVRDGMAPARAYFTGEQAFTSAIHGVTQARRPQVYFLSGHGERRIDNFDPFVGYSSIAKRMQRDNMDLAVLVLGETPRIPEDADALIIAGPNRRISQPELDLIHAYLEQSGRVMMLVDSMTRTGLETVLARWGVMLGDDVVIDPNRTLTGRELFLTEYGLHPITDRIRGVTSVFYMPRSVEPLPRQTATTSDQADKPHVTVLAATSEAGWAERDPDQTPLRFDPDVDRPGPISVAVAVERGPVPGIDVQIRSTRMVVFGDSGFVSNGGLTGGDEDFFMGAFNWLLDRDELMAVAPRSVEQVRLVLDKHQIRQLLWLVVVGMPTAAAALGGLVWWRRRR